MFLYKLNFESQHGILYYFLLSSKNASVGMIYYIYIMVYITIYYEMLALQFNNKQFKWNISIFIITSDFKA